MDEHHDKYHSIYKNLLALKGFYRKINTPEFINKFVPTIQIDNQGIPDRDLVALLNYVQKEKFILLIRPVEMLTKTLHEEGRHPTKGFNIKGKSSSWGAWAGFIPVDQTYSKLFGKNIKKIEKANKAVQTCINNGHAIATHLKITEKRFQELRIKEIIYPQKRQEGEYLVIYCPRPPGGNSFELCYAKKETTQLGIEYAIYTAEKKPFQVLGDIHLKRPLIADYDLLAIYTSWENFGRNKIRPNPDITVEERRRKLSPSEQRRSIESPERFYARELPNLGNVAPETIKIIKGLNNALNKGDYLECIHHNDDVGSPASDPSANYPITALLPTKIEGLSEISLIKSAQEFVEFIEKIKRFNYRVEVNPLWEQAIQLAAKQDFYQNIVHFESHFNSQGLEGSLTGVPVSLTPP